MSEPIRYLGLDVSKDSIAVAVAEPDGSVATYGTIANDPGTVRRLVAKLSGDAALSAAYEAGPTGYALHRQLVSLGVRSQVVAPTLIPRPPGNRVKTDRRDALQLVRLLRRGDLVPVWVPDQAHEALRDLVRARDDARTDALRAKQRLGKFLLHQGIVRQARVGQPWSMKYHAWLNTLAFSDRAAQLTFDDVARFADGLLAGVLLGRVNRPLDSYEVRTAHAANGVSGVSGPSAAYFAPLRARLSKRCAKKRELFLLAFAYRAHYSAWTRE